MSWLHKIGEALNTKGNTRDSLSAVQAMFNTYTTSIATSPSTRQQVDVAALGAMLRGRMNAARDSGDASRYEVYSAAFNNLNLLS